MDWGEPHRPREASDPSPAGVTAPVAAIGHGTTPPNIAWLRGELVRVLRKLEPDVVHVAYVPGVAVDIAEAAVVCDIHVTLQLPDTLQATMDRTGIDGFVARTDALVMHELVLTGTNLAALGGRRRARQTELSRELVRQFTTQLVVYDNRVHGTVIEHLNMLNEHHDLVLINPAERRTVRRRGWMQPFT